MLITRVLKLLKFDLSAKRAIAPSVDINSTILNKMHVGERAPALAPQPPPSSQLFLLDPRQPLLTPILHFQLNFENTI